MKITHLMTLTTLTCALTLTSVAQAETIEISVSKQAPELQNIDRPTNGMSKTDVERIYGAPFAVNGPTGKPPITSWSYEQFTVYFEYDRVLHSVLNRPQPTE